MKSTTVTRTPSSPGLSTAPTGTGKATLTQSKSLSHLPGVEGADPDLLPKKPVESEQKGDDAGGSKEPQDLPNPDGPNLGPTKKERPLHAPKGPALATVTTEKEEHEDADIGEIFSDGMDWLFGDDSDPDPYEISGDQMSRLFDTTPASKPAAPSALGPAPGTNPPGVNQSQPPNPTPVTQQHVKDANDLVARDKAELKAEKKALKWETQMVVIMVSLQKYVDQLATKYGLTVNDLAPLKDLFVQAEQECTQQAQQRTQNLQQVSASLAQHMSEAERLSELARGQQPTNPKNQGQLTGKELDDLIQDFEDDDQKVVKKAVDLANKTLKGAAAKSTGRTGNSQELRERFQRELEAEEAAEREMDQALKDLNDQIAAAAAPKKMVEKDEAESCVKQADVLPSLPGSEKSKGVPKAYREKKEETPVDPTGMGPQTNQGKMNAAPTSLKTADKASADPLLEKMQAMRTNLQADAEAYREFNEKHDAKMAELDQQIAANMKRNAENEAAIKKNEQKTAQLMQNLYPRYPKNLDGVTIGETQVKKKK